MCYGIGLSIIYIYIYIYILLYIYLYSTKYLFTFKIFKLSYFVNFKFILQTLMNVRVMILIHVTISLKIVSTLIRAMTASAKMAIQRMKITSALVCKHNTHALLVS